MSAAFELGSAAGYLVRRGERRLAATWGAEGVGLTIPQFSILLELDRHSGLDQRTLGERVMVDPSTTADVCRRLLERGYLERRRNPDDARRYVVQITAAGHALLALALPAVAAVDARLLERLTPSERRRFVALFQKAMGPHPGVLED